jgi:predicted RNA-binding Zn ribbon-like protein
MTREPGAEEPGPPPAPGEEISPALALVNTRLMRGGQVADLIADPAAAGGWLASRGLIPPGGRVTGADAVRLRELRESVRALFAARAAGRGPAASDVGVLNAALAAAPPVPALAWDESGPHRAEGAPRAGMATAALARLARAALDLLTASGGPEPAPCGAHGCIRWFLRTHAARQWCSTRCGDRVRAARHYARHH